MSTLSSSQEKKENENPKPISRRTFLKTGTAAAVVAVVAGVGGYLAYQSSLPRSTAPAPATTPRPAQTTQPAAPAATPSPTPKVAALGASADERALNAARELVKTTNNKTIKLLLAAGAGPNWAPNEKENFEGWNGFLKPLGLTIDVEEVPFLSIFEKVIQESVVKRGTWDVIAGMDQGWLSDFAEAGVLHPKFQEWADKYGPEFGETTYTTQCAPLAGAIKSSRLANGNLATITLCSDSHTLFVQRALIENPKEQEAFEKQHGYAMPYVVGPPATWAQYKDMVSFFDRPDTGVRGAMLWRTRDFPQEFYNRIWQAGGVFFNDNMEAQLNTRLVKDIAIQMKELNQFMDPILLTQGIEIIYGQFPEGKGWSCTSWASLATFTVKAKGQKFLRAFRPPGTIVNGKLNNTPVVWNQFGGIINAHAKNPELAYLFLQFMASPRKDTEGKRFAGFFNDPWRSCSFKNDAVAAKFPEGATEVIADVFENAVPVFALVGSNELDIATASELSDFYTGQKDVDQAIGDMNDKYNAVTQRVGVEKQRQKWESLKKRMPNSIKELHGWT